MCSKLTKANKSIFKKYFSIFIVSDKTILRNIVYIWNRILYRNKRRKSIFIKTNWVPCGLWLLGSRSQWILLQRSESSSVTLTDDDVRRMFHFTLAKQSTTVEVNVRREPRDILRFVLINSRQSEGDGKLPSIHAQWMQITMKIDPLVSTQDTAILFLFAFCSERSHIEQSRERKIN